MDFFSLLIIVIIAAHIILVGLIFKSLLGAAGTDPETTADGRKAMRPSKVLLWTGVLLAIWAILGLYLGVEALGRERGVASGLLVALIVTLTAGLSAAWLLARYLNYRIVWNNETLEVTSWRGKLERYRWADLTELTHRSGQDAVHMPVDMANTHATIRDLELRFNNQGVIRAAPNLTGYYRFVDDAKRHWHQFEKSRSETTEASATTTTPVPRP